ncbi:Haloacid dehalogenase-like hydrolase (HAD) superfamily protein [Forsythia ovata]|uniref:Haloacid dehalogenase-like hydrolase (HAD) superfamily protein n=1 Tax=Forsythia ovata TaxID=205694 RepID=A0ABD1RL81_9LAMI
MEFDGHHQQVSGQKYECLLFDVDDTLYPLSSGISAQCTKNIIEYMINKLDIEETRVPEMCTELYKEYGTTMAGLKAKGYDFDYDDYHSFVHGRLPYEWLKTDHTLRSLFHSLPIRKVIFSNGNEAHVAKVLSRLGLEDCFDDIICFETLNTTHRDNVKPESDFDVLKTPIVCKPFENAFEQAFKIAKINPQKTLFFDDSIRNLQNAYQMGLRTVWVGASHLSKGVDYALESIHNIAEALPELWEDIEKLEDVRYSGKAAIETCVRA